MTYIIGIVLNNGRIGWGFYALLIFNALTLLYMIYQERHNAYYILIWLFGLLLFPIMGFVFYILLGRGPRLNKRKRYLRKLKDDKVYHSVLQESFADFERLRDNNLDLALEMIKFNIRYNDSACGLFNRVKIYTDIEQQYEDMLADIAAAKESVSVQYFIYKKDHIGIRLRDLMVQKAKEGVKVRLLVDDVGSMLVKRNFFDALEEAGGEVSRFLSSRWGYFNRNINYRNHRKMVIIDRKYAYIGGANIGDEYANQTKRKWRDTHMRVEGDAVAFINLRFLQDYAFACKHSVDVEEFKFTPHNITDLLPMQLISSGPDTEREEIKQTYLKLIYSAKKRIWIQTPYFIPDDAFQDALLTAIKSGIDVRIMIPGIPDKKYVYYATLSYVYDLVKAGAKVYKYPAFLHSKTLLVDDQVSSLGTFNIDIRSFKLHFEATCLMYGTEITERMSDIFENDMKVSNMVTVEDVRLRKRSERMKEGVMRIISPLL